jgi:hypothetical protein
MHAAFARNAGMGCVRGLFDDPVVLADDPSAGALVAETGWLAL